MDDLRSKYFPHLKPGLEKLSDVNFDGKAAYLETGTPIEINKLLRKLHDPNIMTLVFFDELMMPVENGRQDFYELVAPSNLEFFIAVRPWAYSLDSKEFELNLPNDPNILASQLLGRHRSCREIYELSMHIMLAKSGFPDFMDKVHLREKADPIDGIPLPEGHVPLWIVYDKSWSVGKLLRLVENEYMGSGTNITIAVDNLKRVEKTEGGITSMRTNGVWNVLPRKGGDENALNEVQMWMNEVLEEGVVGAARRHCGRRRLAVGTYEMRGSEDDAVIYINPNASDANELVTRARERLVIITYQEG